MRKRFLCSYDRIELVISYICNMQCLNCDAMVPQALSKESMTLEQIERFIQESIDKRIFWQHIRVLGGEPTLHKNILEILAALIKYKEFHSPNTKIQLVTNGYGKIVKKILLKIPKQVEIENSEKSSNIQPTFSPINQAPIDIPEYSNSDFTKACWIPALCGITLDMHGYYPCSAAAAIDRVFGFDVGKKDLPIAQYATLEEMFANFCKLCGHYYDKINNLAVNDISNKEERSKFENLHKEKFLETQKDSVLLESIVSPVWEDAFKAYKIKKPVLTKY